MLWFTVYKQPWQVFCWFHLHIPEIHQHKIIYSRWCIQIPHSPYCSANTILCCHVAVSIHTVMQHTVIKTRLKHAHIPHTTLTFFAWAKHANKCASQTCCLLKSFTHTHRTLTFFTWAKQSHTLNHLHIPHNTPTFSPWTKHANKCA